jgi:hypothetical protein
MALEEAIFDYLTTDAGVMAVAGDSVYVSHLPEGTTLPAASFFRVSTDRRYDHDPFPETVAWVRSRIQVNCWYTTYDGARELGNAIMRALSGYTGFMGDMLISSVFAVNEFENYEPDTKLYRRSMDFMVAYEEDLEASSS